jgi:hypothetical protein
MIKRGDQLRPGDIAVFSDFMYALVISVTSELSTALYMYCGRRHDRAFVVGHDLTKMWAWDYVLRDGVMYNPQNKEWGVS